MEVTPETPDSFSGEYNPVSRPAQAMIQETVAKDEDDIDYERGTGSGSGSGSEENTMENKVLRTIKEVDDSKGISLLKPIKEEEDKTSIVGENTKHVKTD